MLNDNDQIHIERYLKNQLKGKELEDFNNRLKTDAEFAQEVALQKDIFEGIKMYAQEREKILLDEFDEQYQQVGTKTPPAKTLFPKKYLIAASVTILLASAIVISIIYIPQSINNEKLFTKNFTPASYPEIGYLKSADQLDSLEKIAAINAFQHYSEEQYQEAAKYFEYILKTLPDDNTSLYYLGNCYLINGDITKAINTFQQIIKAEENVYTDESLWYLALAYLKNDDLSKTRDYLNRVISITPGSLLKEQADKLLKEIEE